ncbi:MAG: hypothetical protein FJ272_00785 [Planctomycetes bacterium]|nr:hypothetical protein [Planctomycetota bacterium]
MLIQNVRAEREPLLLFLGLLLAYNVNLRVLHTGDCFAAPHVTLSLLSSGNFDLDEYSWEDVDPMSYGVVEVGGRKLSKYPVMSSVLAAPIFFVALGVSNAHKAPLIYYVAKFCATVFVSLSVVFLYLAVRRVRSEWALTTALVYGFGTCAWTVSQALWQHPGSMMFLALALYLLVRGEKEVRFVPPAGGALAMAVACRYFDIVSALFLSVFVLHRHRGQFLRFAAWGAPVGVFLAAYHEFYFGSLFGTGYGHEAASGWSNPMLAGFLGLMISPGVGLLFYSPVLLFAFVGMARTLVQPAAAGLLLRYLTVAFFVSFLLMGKWWCWYGGVCWGYRMIADFMPFLCFFLPLAFREGEYRGWLKWAFLVLLCLSVAVQLLGILTFDHSWHMAFDRGKDDQSWLWSLRDCQIVDYVRRNVWYVGPYRVDL